MKTGKKIIFCDNSEREILAEWTTVSKNLCEAKMLEIKKKIDISTIKPIHLFISPLKNQNRWELILEKGTEIGIASFTPLITDRTETKELRKFDRLERIIKEAAEQSGRTILPKIHTPIQFYELLTLNSELSTLNHKPSTLNHKPLTLNLIPTIHEKTQTIEETLNHYLSFEASSYAQASKNKCNVEGTLNHKPLTINLYIGPEGGFTEKEIEEAINSKFQPITLGTQILRTETAAIVSSSILFSEK